VLDEPTTGLDLVARHGVMETMRRLALAGTTIVLITHHIEEIVPEIARVVLLRDGRILSDGPRETTLTAQRLSAVFAHPVVVEAADGYYYARPEGVKTSISTVGCDDIGRTFSG